MSRLHKKPKKNKGAGASVTSVYRVRIQLYMPKREYRGKKIAAQKIVVEYFSFHGGDFRPHSTS